MKNAVKKYLEEQIQTDEALAKVYDESKLDKCIDYIIGQAKKNLKGNNGAIEDSVVYHWARDFYFGDLDTSKPVKEVEQNVGNINEPSNDSESSVKKMTIQKIIQDEPEVTPKKSKSFVTMAEVDEIRGENKTPKQSLKKKKEDPVDDGQLMFEF